ncbi:MAG: prolipoprotein diacylglyceryl transferase, partial [Eubacteriales bacterium]
MVSKLSFPGLGIGEFAVNSVALRIGSVEITWYGIIICIGVFCGFAYFCYRAGKAGINFESVLDYAIITVPCAVVGARIYYVIFNLESFNSFYDVIAVWNGGIAIYGAIIAGGIAVFCVSKYKKHGFFAIADMLVPGVMLGQIIGRWGNFMNGEAFGSETSLPWRMGISNFLTDYQTIYVHPTFLYESLWNLAGFILINIFYKKKRFNGEITMWYFSWY